MATIKAPIVYGSRGDNVTELQKALNKNGYNLAEDGVFGSKTQAAVKDYQNKNSLLVDGKVGNETWGSLFGSGGKTSTQKTTAPTEFSYEDYAESDTVAQAKAALDAQLLAKPGAYQSQWKAQIDDILSRIQNREDFSYDVNGDALYQQYKDNYIQQGRMAMQDTMGQAAAMTGGYGNSYAATAGNQAYQAHLGELNDVVPELYQMALDKYIREGDELMEQYALLGDQESQDYAKYQDEYNQWLAERDNAYSRYDAERDYDYGKYADGRDFAYGEYQDKVARDQWQQQFDITEEQWELEKEAYLDSKKTSTTGSGSSGGGSSSGGSSGGSSGSGSTSKGASGTSKTSGVSDSIKQKAAASKSNQDLAAYLDDLTDNGALTEEEADALYIENMTPDKVGLGDRTWSVVDDGGTNWFWGIDNNAKVKDQYGNTYSLDKLVTALTSEGMSKKEAENYVKNLQKKLGI